MKHLFIFILLLSFTIGCKPKELSGARLEQKLIETMSDHLHKTLDPAVKFTVKDVVYYPERSQSSFICQFHVTMHLGNKDTTGIVTATISNDFTKVNRTQ